MCLMHLTRVCKADKNEYINEVLEDCTTIQVHENIIIQYID